MPRQPTASAPATPDADARARTLLRLLDSDDLDAAIEAGLTRFDPACCTLPEAERTRLTQARDQLLAAWAARERYRARTTRLARRTAEREAARPVAAPAAPGQAQALPTAAALALARARARAGKAS